MNLMINDRRNQLICLINDNLGKSLFDFAISFFSTAIPTFDDNYY